MAKLPTVKGSSWSISRKAKGEDNYGIGKEFTIVEDINGFLKCDGDVDATACPDWARVHAIKDLTSAIRYAATHGTGK